MEYDSSFVAGKLRRWETYLNNYRLPSWEEIPDFGLYMEQVITLLKQYLDYMPPELKEEQVITAAAINNYVRTKVIPGPQKKKYYRTHIAYLILICTLKQGLSISLIQKLIPNDLSQEELHTVYTSYTQRHRQVARYFIEQVKSIAAPILSHETDSPMAIDQPKELIVASAVTGSFARLLAEKLLLLQENGGETQKDV